MRGNGKEGRGRRRRRKRRGKDRELGKAVKGEKRTVEDNRGRRENRKYRIGQKPATPHPIKSRHSPRKRQECVHRQKNNNINPTKTTNQEYFPGYQ